MRIGFFLRKRLNQMHETARRIFYLLDYLSWQLLSLSKFKKVPANPEKVLIINSGALGDIFTSFRIIRDLKKNYPSIEFYLYVTEEFRKSIKFAENPLKIKILAKEDMQNYDFDITLFFSLIRKFRKYKNLGVCIGNEYSSIKESLSNLFSLFLNKKAFPRHIHKLKQEIEICRLAGLKINNQLDIKEKFNNPKIKSFLLKSRIKKFIIIHSSGRNFSTLIKAGKIPAYSWPLKRFSDIAEFIIQEYHLPIIFTGSSDERFINEEIIKNIKHKNKVVNLAGKLSVEEMLSLSSLSKMMLSIDTSAVHIAEFAGTPVITLNGPGFPEITGAYGKNSINLFHKGLCVKCRKKGECPEKNNICMKSITVEEVKKAIDKILK